MPKKKEHRRMHVWWVEKEKGNKLQSHLQMWQWNINTTKRITSPALLSLQTPRWGLAAAAVRMTLQKCCHPVPHPSLCWEGGSYPASFFPAALVSFHLLKQIRAAGGRNAGSALGRSTVCRWGMGLWPYRVYKELGEGLGEAWGTSGRAESGTGSCGNCSCGYRLGLRHFCSLSEGRQANARSARFWAEVHSDR